MKSTYGKSWAGNLLILSDLTLDHSKVKQGQSNLKVRITCLLLVPCNVKSTCRISWAGNLRILSGLAFGPYFKVKRWFTGFGELSFWWIQICIGSPMHRLSLS